MVRNFYKKCIFDVSPAFGMKYISCADRHQWPLTDCRACDFRSVSQQQASSSSARKRPAGDDLCMRPAGWGRVAGVVIILRCYLLVTHQFASSR